jgi:hypothetical protein
MKKIFLSVALAVLFNLINSAQDFKETLQSTMTMFDTANSPQDMFNAANRLELIAGKWDTSRIAHYYSAYVFIVISYIEKDIDKKDGYLDKADKQLGRAKELAKTNNDELFVLTAFSANARLAVKPESRWKKYGDLFNENIDSAKILRPDNPRIYYLQGNSVYYTPKMFGGGPQNALPFFQKAEEYYMKESGCDIFKPCWGKKQNSALIEKCMAEEKEQKE